MNSQWLKITQKVAFNIASEASYVYIFASEASNVYILIKTPKIVKNVKLAVKQCYPIGQKLVENAKIKKFK